MADEADLDLVCILLYLAALSNVVYNCDIFCSYFEDGFETNVFFIIAGNIISRCRSSGSQDYGLQVRNSFLAIISRCPH